MQINCYRDLKHFANSRPSLLEFQTKFSIIKYIFSHSKSEQFWKQNTIASVILAEKTAARGARGSLVCRPPDLKKATKLAETCGFIMW